MSNKYNYPKDSLWSQYLVPESKIHGARYNVHMLQDIIEEYTKPGDMILDPFGGVGSILIATSMGRDVVLIEVEERFYEIAKLNQEALVQYCLKNELECGCSSVIHGDSRLLLPIPVDVIITSPPYGDSMKKMDKAEAKIVEYFGSTTAQGYGEAAGQIGNMQYALQRFELKKIYKGCYNSLSVGGRLITVTKDYIKGKKRVNVGADHVRIMLELGFTLEAHHIRTCQITGMQALHMKEEGYKPITEEDVNVFVKVKKDS